MICDTDEKEAQWQAFQRSAVPCTAQVRWEAWGWVEIINTPMLLFRLACIGWDLQLPPVASNGDSLPTRGDHP